MQAVRPPDVILYSKAWDGWSIGRRLTYFLRGGHPGYQVNSSLHERFASVTKRHIGLGFALAIHRWDWGELSTPRAWQAMNG